MTVSEASIFGLGPVGLRGVRVVDLGLPGKVCLVRFVGLALATRGVYTLLVSAKVRDVVFVVCLYSCNPLVAPCPKIQNGGNSKARTQKRLGSQAGRPPSSQAECPPSSQGGVPSRITGRGLPNRKEECPPRP